MDPALGRVQRPRRAESPGSSGDLLDSSAPRHPAGLATAILPWRDSESQGTLADDAFVPTGVLFLHTGTALSPL